MLSWLVLNQIAAENRRFVLSAGLLPVYFSRHLTPELLSAVVYYFCASIKELFFNKDGWLLEAAGSLLNYTRRLCLWCSQFINYSLPPQQLLRGYQFCALPDSDSVKLIRERCWICLFAERQQNRWRHRELLYLLKFGRQRLLENKAATLNKWASAWAMRSRRELLSLCFACPPAQGPGSILSSTSVLSEQAFSHFIDVSAAFVTQSQSITRIEGFYWQWVRMPTLNNLRSAFELTVAGFGTEWELLSDRMQEEKFTKHQNQIIFKFEIGANFDWL